MDPNANLKEQQEILATTERLTTRLRDLRHALRDWLAKGGFPPAWTDYPVAAEDFKAWLKRAAKFQDLIR